MKELSIEQKAKRYDLALERAKEILEVGLKDTRDKRVVLSFFPELVESEDEGICRKLIAFLKQCKAVYGDGFKQFGLDIDDALAWLEKQGEQKPTKIEPKFKVGDIIRLKGTVAEYTIKKVTDTTYYTNGWSCSIERCEEDYELVEQKPAECSRNSIEGQVTIEPQSETEKAGNREQLSPEMKALLSQKVEELDLSVRTRNILKASGIDTILDICRLKRIDCLNFRNGGKRSLAELDDFLAAHNLTWGMNV